MRCISMFERHECQRMISVARTTIKRLVDCSDASSSQNSAFVSIKRRGVTACSLSLCERAGVRGVTVFGSFGGLWPFRILLINQFFLVTSQESDAPDPRPQTPEGDGYFVHYFGINQCRIYEYRMSTMRYF
jgi:hypothetical protein